MICVNLRHLRISMAPPPVRVTSGLGQGHPKKFVVGPEGGKTLLVLQIAEEGERIPLLVMDVDGKRIAFDAWRTVFGESFSMSTGA